MKKGSESVKSDLNWKTLLTEELIEWLVDGEPWVAYRTLTDLMDKEEEEKEVSKTRIAIPEHPLIKKIFDGLNEDGYWGKPKDIHTW